eukprot:3794769-Karenia_brevis.AAC.1
MALGGLSGALWGHFLCSGPGNGSRKLLWSSLRVFFALGPEMAPGALGLSRTIFWSGRGHGSRSPLWNPLGPFPGLGLELAPGILFEPFWTYFVCLGPEMVPGNEASLGPSEAIFSSGPSKNSLQESLFAHPRGCSPYRADAVAPPPPGRHQALQQFAFKNLFRASP